jgi:hypothetical protein
VNLTFDYSPSFSVEVKNRWSCTSTVSYTFMVFSGVILQCFRSLDYALSHGEAIDERRIGEHVEGGVTALEFA